VSRERVEPFNCPGDLVIDEHGLGEAFPAVHDAVADGVQLPLPQRRVDVGVHLFQGFGMVPGAHDFAVAVAAVAHADSFDQPLGQHAAGFDITDLVLERGRA
jgi:hypothetical protein